jgi:V-type H+-transporting ATPase subunit D
LLLPDSFQGIADPVQVANKKQRDNAAADAERKQRKEELAARGEENEAPEPEQAAGPTDLLAAEEDEDVIF